MKIARAIAHLVGVIMIAGCATEGPVPAMRVAGDSGFRLDTVNIIDKSLARWHGPQFGRHTKIAVESTSAERTPTGTLEARAFLRNRTDGSMEIEARTQFYDANGKLVDGPTGWQRIHLAPNSVATYRALSTKTSDVFHYYIEVRKGR